MDISTLASRLAGRLSRWRRHIAAVAVLTAGGVALFGVLHAILIEPIWERLVGGVPRAALTGIGMTWCYSELRSRGRLRPGVAGGLLFGGAIWLGLLPVSIAAAILRAAGVRSQLGWLEPPLDLSLVAITDAVAGFLLTRSARGTASAAACMVGVLAPLNAPFAIEIDLLQRQLLLGLLPIYLAGTTVLSVLFCHGSAADPARLTAYGGLPTP